MKKLKILVSTVIILLVSQSIAFPVDANIEERTKTFKVDKGAKLTVSVDPGNVIVNTWDKNEVYVEIKGMDEDELENVKMEKTNGNVIVEYESDGGWSNNAEYRISIPIEFNAVIHTTGGNIDLQGNLVGDFDCNTHGGNIKTQDIKGKASVKSDGGNIQTGSINGEAEIETMGGNINIGNVSGSWAKVNTMGGNINVGDASADISVKTYGGNISIGNVGGGAEVTTYGGNISLKKVAGSAEMKTYGGNLSLQSATGEIEASTQGGNISLKDVTGSIDASTQAGDIYVELTPSGTGESNIKTSAGDIELQIPATAKASITAVISVHGGWKYTKDEYKIKSEFQSKTYEADDLGKEIVATYELNGGGQKILLRTVNSDIKIKKLTN